MDIHPISEEQLITFAFGELDGESANAVSTHVTNCTECSTTIALFHHARQILRADDSRMPRAEVIAKANKIFIQPAPQRQVSRTNFAWRPAFTFAALILGLMALIGGAFLGAVLNAPSDSSLSPVRAAVEAFETTVSETWNSLGGSKSEATPTPTRVPFTPTPTIVRPTNTLVVQPNLSAATPVPNGQPPSDSPPGQNNPPGQSGQNTPSAPGQTRNPSIQTPGAPGGTRTPSAGAQPSSVPGLNRTPTRTDNGKADSSPPGQDKKDPPAPGQDKKDPSPPGQDKKDSSSNNQKSDEADTASRPTRQPDKK